MALVGRPVGGKAREYLPQARFKRVERGVVDLLPVVYPGDGFAQEIFGEQASLERCAKNHGIDPPGYSDISSAAAP